MTWSHSSLRVCLVSYLNLKSDLKKKRRGDDKRFCWSFKNVYTKRETLKQDNCILCSGQPSQYRWWQNSIYHFLVLGCEISEVSRPSRRSPSGTKQQGHVSLWEMIWGETSGGRVNQHFRASAAVLTVYGHLKLIQQQEHIICVISV